MVFSANGRFVKEIRLLCYVIGLYTSFVYWGYLQEKITSTNYYYDDEVVVLETNANDDRVYHKWKYPFSLNVFMAFATFFIAAIGNALSPSTSTNNENNKNNNGENDQVKKKNKAEASIWVYAKPAITCALGSPIGYMALDYISFPLVILVKSSKPVPVMLVGLFLYKKRYPWYKYLSVLLLCSGIALFSFIKSSKKEDNLNIYLQCFGIILVGLNVFLDGYTNNEQDYIFETYTSSSLDMMKYVNLWQLFYLLIYLFFGYFLWSHESELFKSYSLFINCQTLRYDILLFCLCASIGQLFIFAVMKEFGSLMWVTLSITRKLFTILLSIVIFHHKISLIQWIGVGCVFSGMTLEVIMNYFQNDKKKQINNESDIIKKKK